MTKSLLIKSFSVRPVISSQHMRQQLIKYLKMSFNVIDLMVTALSLLIVLLDYYKQCIASEETRDQTLTAEKVSTVDSSMADDRQPMKRLCKDLSPSQEANAEDLSMASSVSVLIRRFEDFCVDNRQSVAKDLASSQEANAEDVTPIASTSGLQSTPFSTTPKLDNKSIDGFMASLTASLKAFGSEPKKRHTIVGPYDDRDECLRNIINQLVVINGLVPDCRDIVQHAVTAHLVWSAVGEFLDKNKHIPAIDEFRRLSPTLNTRITPDGYISPEGIGANIDVGNGNGNNAQNQGINEDII